MEPDPEVRGYWVPEPSDQESPPGAIALTEIAVFGDTLIILDSATGTFHTWNDPNANVPTEGGSP